MIGLTSIPYLSINGRETVSSIVVALVKAHPNETLEDFFPKTFQSIENLLKNLLQFANDSLKSEEEDRELMWYLTIFSKLVCARGDVLLLYKDKIISIFEQSIKIVNQNVFKVLSKAGRNCVQSLSEISPINYRLTNENLNQSLEHFLPIRVSFLFESILVFQKKFSNKKIWGKSIEIEKCEVKFHLPSDSQIDFLCDLINKLIYPQLNLFNEKGFKMSNNERLMRIGLIESIFYGCSLILPPIPSEQINHLYLFSNKSFSRNITFVLELLRMFHINQNIIFNFQSIQKNFVR